MKKILVVDDTESVRKTVKIMLSDTYEITEAQSVTALFEVLKEQIPDLILLDIMMPDGNGVTVKTRLKGTPEYKDIPIIFLTAVEEERTKKIASIQAVEYITKPFTEEQIREGIHKVMKD